MHIYTDYIAPLTTWLHHHPNFALLFTFFIAFMESLVIIGTIIPGSLTMTAIGILAGSGVMRFDLTLIFASLGAFCGDGISYVLGFTCSHRLISLWPFNRYPNLLRYGQDFFNRHGGKSVLIGRFIGPLRSITPVIAGMMHMPRLHFFLANFVSAMGWAILYLSPGYIIGAASNQLSSDSARRLFVFVIGFLVALWIIGHLLRVIVRHLTQWFSYQVHRTWLWCKRHKYPKQILTWLSPAQDGMQQRRVIRLLIAWVSCLYLTITFIGLAVQDSWINHLNQPVCFFLQTLRVPSMDTALIIISFMLSPITLTCFTLMILGLSLYSRDWRLSKYWVSLTGTTFLINLLCVRYIPINTTIRLFSEPVPTTFPVTHLCFATALFSFSMYYLLNNYHKHISQIICYILCALLMLAGFSTLYLGDNWLSSVFGAYSLGLTLGLFHWILYRRQYASAHALGITLGLSGLLFVITTTFLYHDNIQSVIHQHTPRPKHYTLNQDTWWYQSEPILPLYSTNRVGRRIGVFNIQYAGSIQELEKRLTAGGWRKQSKSFLYSLIIHAEGRHIAEGLPFMEQLYLNKNPILTMSYRTVKEDDLYILRLWRSNYHLLHYQDAIWLGNVILARKKESSKLSLMKPKKHNGSHLFIHILPAVHDYQITHIPPQDPHLKSLPYDIPSELLIIKN